MYIRLIFIIIILQLAIAILLAFDIYNQKFQTLDLSINPIPKNNLIFSSNTSLKYFYELLPDSIDHSDLSWMNINSKVYYSINKDGLNQVNDYSEEFKTNDIYRIITLGDSFTYGLYVNTNDNWSSILEQILNKKMSCRNIKKFEVINLGVPGYDIQYAEERYRIRGKKYNPDLVLWLQKDGNYQEIKEYTYPIMKDYLESLKKDGTYDKRITLKGTQNAFYQSWKLATEKLKGHYGDKQILNYQKKVLENFTNNYKGKTLFFGFLSTIYQNLIKELEGENNKFLYSSDILNNFNYNSDSFYPYDQHPNVKGHMLIAKDLYNYLTKNNIIPCEKP